MNTRRAVAYVRLTGPVSPPLDPHGPRDQETAIANWAARENVDIAAWATDVGIDGATPIAERPGLMRAYRAVVEQRADVIVAANADCFSRDELVAWLIERAALTQGAVLETADGSRPPLRSSSTPPLRGEESWTRGTIELARAYERVTFRARLRAVLAEKKARGERVGTVPYGYRLAADGVHLEPDDAEQAVIASIMDFSRAGLSQRAIVAHLAARGVAGRTGAPLRQTQVAKILKGTRPMSARTASR